MDLGWLPMSFGAFCVRGCTNARLVRVLTKCARAAIRLPPAAWFQFSLHSLVHSPCLPAAIPYHMPWQRAFIQHMPCHRPAFLITYRRCRYLPATIFTYSVTLRHLVQWITLEQLSTAPRGCLLRLPLPYLA